MSTHPIQFGARSRYPILTSHDARGAFDRLADATTKRRILLAALGGLSQSELHGFIQTLSFSSGECLGVCGEFVVETKVKFFGMTPWCQEGADRSGRRVSDVRSNASHTPTVNSVERQFGTTGGSRAEGALERRRRSYGDPQ